MTLSVTARESAFAQETGQAWVYLLTISHASLSEPIRVTDNHTNLEVDGNTFVGFAFEIDVPDESDQAPRVTIKIDNVDRIIVDAIRACDSPPECSLSVVLAETPDVVEAGPFVMTLGDADYDALIVTGTLVFEDILNEPFPGDSIVPASFPGLF